MQEKIVLLAGTTGYLGGHLLKQLILKGYHVRALVRNLNRIPIKDQLNENELKQIEFVEAEVTKPETLKIELFQGVNSLITSIGITRQKDGLTYMSVDYQANKNLLDKALEAKIEKFLYISVMNGQKLRHLKMIEAKEKFCDDLQNTQSTLQTIIIRPNGFFSDMADFLDMAKDGKVYLFGHGNYKLNPIHGEDLAEFCVDKCFQQGQQQQHQNYDIGGPDIFTQKQLAELALISWGKNPSKITHIWDWVRRSTICMVRTFSSQKSYGPIEFFMTAMGMDAISPQYGVHHLKDHFKEEVDKIKSQKLNKK